MDFYRILRNLLLFCAFLSFTVALSVEENQAINGLNRQIDGKIDLLNIEVLKLEGSHEMSLLALKRLTKWKKPSEKYADLDPMEKMYARFEKVSQNCKSRIKSKCLSDVQKDINENYKSLNNYFTAIRKEVKKIRKTGEKCMKETKNCRISCVAQEELKLAALTKENKVLQTEKNFKRQTESEEVLTAWYLSYP